MKYALGLAAAAAVIGAASGALAQKSKDTVRVGYFEPLKAVDGYYDGKQETSFLIDSVYDTLVYYDDRGGKVVPLLAKSWTRVSDTVLEFQLRDDVKWHDGEKFTADDVVYTLNWLIDPKTRLRFKANYTWMKAVEKTGPYSVRIESHKPYAIDLLRLRSNTDIFPKHIHEKLENKSTFGQAPVGTGPYKVVGFDRNRGAILERNDDYKIGGDYKKASNVKRFETITIPEIQTQVAEFQTGGLDLLQGLPKDQTEALEADPRFAVTASRNLVYIYFMLDAKGRSGLEPVTDPKVRRALHMAVDRNAIAKGIIAGGEQAITLDGLCDERQFGCVYSKKAPAYNPEQAKKLLAEAGYADGFDITISTTSRAASTAEAVAGFLRDINVRAAVQPLTFTAYRKVQTDGKLNALVHTWSSSGLPDVAVTMAFFFSPGSRDYHGDPMMFELEQKGITMHDRDAREAVYRQAFDRINEMHYNMVVTTFPAVFVHTKDIRIRKGALNAYGANMTDVFWK